MFGLHNLSNWNIDRLMGLSLRTSAEYVPWFAAALFAWLVIAAFCMLISFGRCAFKDHMEHLNFGAQRDWCWSIFLGLGCTRLYGPVYLHVYLLGCCLFGSVRHLLAVFWSCHHLLVCIVRWISVFCCRLSSQCASKCFQKLVSWSVLFCLD